MNNRLQDIALVRCVHEVRLRREGQALRRDGADVRSGAAPRDCAPMAAPGSKSQCRTAAELAPSRRSRIRDYLPKQRRYGLVAACVLVSAVALSLCARPVRSELSPEPPPATATTTPSAALLDALAPASATLASTGPSTGPAGVATAPLQTAPTTQPALGEMPTTTPTTRPALAQPPATAPTTRPLASATTQPVARSDAGEPYSRGYSRSSRKSRDRSGSARAPSAEANAGTSNSLQPKSLPTDYSVLTQRSIFEKGRHIVDVGSGTSHPPGPPGPRPGPPPPGPLPPNVPADALIFNGATQTADGAYAFIEDIGSNTIALVQQGDAIVGGKVVGIAFDHLQILVDGKTRDIQIGQTLTGRVTAAPPISSAAPTSDSGDATSGGSGDSNAVLERMRKKREAETGGK